MPVTDAPRRSQRLVAPRPWVVLLVDDEPDILATLGDLMEQQLPGVKVLRARSGRQGLDTLRDERVDLVIADFKMSGMDGIEFLYIVRTQQPSLPRAMLTAYADKALAERAASEARVHAFLSKAASPDDFIDHVGSLLSYTPGIVPMS